MQNKLNIPRLSKMYLRARKNCINQDIRLVIEKR